MKQQKIELVIPGEPIAASRPRVTRRGFAFIAEPYRSYKVMAHQEVVKQYQGELLTEALRVEVSFYRSVQKSVSKVERVRRLSGVHRPTMKPDIDNLFKAVTDACTGVIWKDDNQIVEIVASKHYSEEPRVEMTISQTD